MALWVPLMVKLPQAVREESFFPGQFTNTAFKCDLLRLATQPNSLGSGAEHHSRADGLSWISLILVSSFRVSEALGNSQHWQLRGQYPRDYGGTRIGVRGHVCAKAASPSHCCPQQQPPHQPGTLISSRQWGSDVGGHCGCGIAAVFLLA